MDKIEESAFLVREAEPSMLWFGLSGLLNACEFVKCKNRREVHKVKLDQVAKIVNVLLIDAFLRDSG